MQIPVKLLDFMLSVITGTLTINQMKTGPLVDPSQQLVPLLWKNNLKNFLEEFEQFKVYLIQNFS